MVPSLHVRLALGTLDLCVVQDVGILLGGAVLSIPCLPVQQTQHSVHTIQLFARIGLFGRIKAAIYTIDILVSIKYYYQLQVKDAKEDYSTVIIHIIMLHGCPQILQRIFS